jgi:hypothetical protein
MMRTGSPAWDRFHARTHSISSRCVRWPIQIHPGPGRLGEGVFVFPAMYGASARYLSALASTATTRKP